MCDFSTLWIDMWVLKRAPWWNILLHSTQLPGFPPLCVGMWPFRWGLPEFLIAFNYLYHFSPLWVIMWPFRLSSTSEGYLTLVMFLPMNKKVSFQISNLGESIIALSTIIWFFSTALCVKRCICTQYGRMIFFCCIHDIWSLSNTTIPQLNYPWLAQSA
jgi:hypothetical protein